ncbi:hypothetical protein PGT21_021966 [Puccinia graminis f. sp. tritici]|nr:hypothetical protein PGT21_021966 [Puccinia graminis f. sp. tritici]
MGSNETKIGGVDCPCDEKGDCDGILHAGGGGDGIENAGNSERLEVEEDYKAPIKVIGVPTLRIELYDPGNLK